MGAIAGGAARRVEPRQGPLCVLRGGGDLATGVAWRLTRAGWPVVVLELAEPLTVRRSVALSTAVTQGHVSVQGMRGVRADTPAAALALADRLAGARGGAGAAVVVAPELSSLSRVLASASGLPQRHRSEEPAARPDVVVDARVAKRNIDTSITDADFVVGLGPGFTAGRDCHAVVETMRGHQLGRVIWDGSALANTGTPALLGGRAASRVLRAPVAGRVSWLSGIGDAVREGQRLGDVAGEAVTAPFDGVMRGAVRAGTRVPANFKIGDVDPRCDRSACWEISDKALAVGGGVLEAILAHRNGLTAPHRRA